MKLAPGVSKIPELSLGGLLGWVIYTPILQILYYVIFHFLKHIPTGGLIITVKIIHSQTKHDIMLIGVNMLVGTEEEQQNEDNIEDQIDESSDFEEVELQIDDEGELEPEKIEDDETTEFKLIYINADAIAMVRDFGNEEEDHSLVFTSIDGIPPFIVQESKDELYGIVNRKLS